ncbi:hypothetical protein D3C71_872130 [compost metagenome]
MQVLLKCVCRVLPAIGQIEEHDVGLRRLCPHAGAVAHAFVQQLRQPMVFGQSLDVMVQRMQRRCGQHTGLAHRAARRLSHAPRPCNEGRTAAQRTADRRTQPFAEAHRHGVEVPRDAPCAGLGRRRIAGRGRVEQARAIQVRRQAVPPRQASRGAKVRIGQASPPQRVLQRKKPRDGEVLVVRLDRLGDRRQRQSAVVRVVQRLRLHAAEHRGAAGFPAVAVRHLADDVLVAAPAMRQHRAQVGLRARRHEHRRLEAQHAGDARLQCVDGRVFAISVVAHGRALHGLVHRGRGPRDRVAAQIDARAHAAPSVPPSSLLTTESQ